VLKNYYVTVQVQYYEGHNFSEMNQWYDNGIHVFPSSSASPISLKLCNNHFHHRPVPYSPLQSANAYSYYRLQLANIAITLQYWLELPGIAQNSAVMASGLKHWLVRCARQYLTVLRNVDQNSASNGRNSPEFGGTGSPHFV
jgi:hypothetical protein